MPFGVQNQLLLLLATLAPTPQAAKQMVDATIITGLIQILGDVKIVKGAAKVNTSSSSSRPVKRRAPGEPAVVNTGAGSSTSAAAAAGKSHPIGVGARGAPSATSQSTTQSTSQTSGKSASKFASISSTTHTSIRSSQSDQLKQPTMMAAATGTATASGITELEMTALRLLTLLAPAYKVTWGLPSP